MNPSDFSLLDAVSAVVVVLDRSGRIVHWNRAASELSGYELEEVQGRYVWDFLLTGNEVGPRAPAASSVSRCPGPRRPR